MFPNIKPTDSAAVLGVVNPASIAAGAAATAWVPVANFHNFLAIIQAGTLGSSATLDAKIRQATDASGTNAKDVTGKAITQMAAGTDDNKQALINFRASDLDTEGGFDYVELQLTVGTATSAAAAVLMGFDARFAPPVDSSASPAINYGAASVVQIV